MAKYNLPLDIYNRAAQHMKKPRVSSTTANTQISNELSFAYDKVRQYELERNLWVFATREAIVRAVRNDTMLIQPALWSSTATYAIGDIVAYPQGTLWVAKVINTNEVPSNTTQTPGQRLVWDSYFGPLTAERFRYDSDFYDTGQPWQSPIYPRAHGDTDRVSGYNAGELVYIPKGDGTAVVYQALEDTDEPPWYAKPWDSNYFYKAGDICGFPADDPALFDPDESDPLSGPNVLGSNAYISLSNINVGNDPTLTQKEAPVPIWSVTTQYEPTAYVLGSDNQVYYCKAASLGDANINPSAVGYNPVTDYGNVYWQPTKMYNAMWSVNVPANRAYSNKWQAINATLLPITIAWPLGAGPAEDTFTVNIFKLPANWLRLAPDNPKTGITPWLGGPTFVPQRDWVFYGDGYMVSSERKPVRLRFVADIQDVSRMDAMFCEAFALVLAQECAPACDAEEALPSISAKYRIVVGDARQVNAIEVGPVTPPDDQYISVRY